MAKFHVTWVYDNSAIAMTDTIKASNSEDAQRKAVQRGQNFTMQDPAHRVVHVGSIQRMS